MSRSNMGRRSCQPGPVCLLDGGLGRNKPHLGMNMGAVSALGEVWRVHCAATKRGLESALCCLIEVWRVHCAASKRGLESALCCH